MVELKSVSSDADVERLARLAHAIWHEFYPTIISPAQVDYMVARLQSVEALRLQMAEGCRYFILKRGGVTLGYTGVTSDAESAAIKINQLHLTAAARGSGAGREVMEQIVGTARDTGMTTLYLTVNRFNTGAIGFYERMGFRSVEQLTIDIGGGFVMDDLKMEKDVS